MQADRARPNENIGLWYHELSKDISMGGRVRIPLDSSTWPDSWATIEYKEYGHSTVIKLFPISECRLEMGLTDVLLGRKSRRNFKERDHKISLKELSTFIANSIGLSGRSNSFNKNNKNIVTEHRMYPSGGGRFPLEFYFLIKNSLDIGTGLYHYNVKGHSLMYLRSLESLDLENTKIHGYDWANEAPVHIFVTAIFDRNTRKYGERGYRYVLLEAGHVGENFYLVASAMGLSAVAVGGVKDVAIENMILVNGQRESLVHTFLLG